MARCRSTVVSPRVRNSPSTKPHDAQASRNHGSPHRLGKKRCVVHINKYVESTLEGRDDRGGIIGRMNDLENAFRAAGGIIEQLVRAIVRDELRRHLGRRITSSTLRTRR